MFRIFPIAVAVLALGACTGRSESPVAPSPAPDAQATTSLPADPAAPAASSSGRNLFIDGGFESGDPAFPSWMISIHADSEAFAFDLDNDVVHEGTHSLRVRRVREEPYAAIVQPFRKRELGGAKRFRLSGWFKGENVTGPAYLHAGFFAHGGVIGEADSADRLQGDFDWTQLALEIELPERSDRLEAGVTVTGDGTVWIDGLELVPLPD